MLFRSWVSQTTRMGSRPPGRRQVSLGSSAITVPTPAMIARWRWRRVWTCCRASYPVTHWEAPVWAAIFPSIVMAYFITT